MKQSKSITTRLNKLAGVTEPEGRNGFKHGYAQEIKQIAEQMNLGVQQGFVEHPETGEYISFDDFIQWYNQNK